MATKYMKKYSSSLDIKKVQIKISLRVSLQAGNHKKTNNNKCW
jgi:hypothetical protein